MAPARVPEQTTRVADVHIKSIRGDHEALQQQHTVGVKDGKNVITATILLFLILIMYYYPALHYLPHFRHLSVSLY